MGFLSSVSTQFNTTLRFFRTQAFESRKTFRGIHRGVGVATFVLCEFYESISFMDELLVHVSNSPTYEYRMVQYRLCAINMQKIEKSR